MKRVNNLVKPFLSRVLLWVCVGAALVCQIQTVSLLMLTVVMFIDLHVFLSHPRHGAIC